MEVGLRSGDELIKILLRSAVQYIDLHLPRFERPGHLNGAVGPRSFAACLMGVDIEGETGRDWRGR